MKNLLLVLCLLQAPLILASVGQCGGGSRLGDVALVSAGQCGGGSLALEGGGGQCGGSTRAGDGSSGCGG